LGVDARFGLSNFESRALAGLASFLVFSAAAGFLAAVALITKVDFFVVKTIFAFFALSFRPFAGLLGFLIGLL